MSEKSWPVLLTWTNAPARPMKFQLWDGYGDKFDGTGFTFFLKAKLGETTVIDAQELTAVDENNGLYFTTFDFTNHGDHHAQITVKNGVLDEDYGDPITIRVREKF